MSKCVLIVVDDLMVQTTVEESAKALGVPCERARTGADALKKASENPPGVVVLDFTSERLKPLALLKRLKEKDCPASAAPVVGFVSHAQTAIQTKIHDLGCEFVYPRSALISQATSILRMLVVDKA